MKYVFLMLYLWHRDDLGRDSLGGPAITITAMPSLAICEKVGAQAKTFADGQKPVRGDWFRATPSIYSCIEVDDKPVVATTKCSP